MLKKKAWQHPHLTDDMPVIFAESCVQRLRGIRCLNTKIKKRWLNCWPAKTKLRRKSKCLRSWGWKATIATTWQRWRRVKASWLLSGDQVQVKTSRWPISFLVRSVWVLFARRNYGKINFPASLTRQKKLPRRVPGALQLKDLQNWCYQPPSQELTTWYWTRSSYYIFNQKVAIWHGSHMATFALTNVILYMPSREIQENLDNGRGYKLCRVSENVVILQGFFHYASGHPKSKFWAHSSKHSY